MNRAAASLLLLELYSELTYILNGIDRNSYDRTECYKILTKTKTKTKTARRCNGGIVSEPESDDDSSRFCKSGTPSEESISEESGSLRCTGRLPRCLRFVFAALLFLFTMVLHVVPANVPGTDRYLYVYSVLCVELSCSLVDLECCFSSQDG